MANDVKWIKLIVGMFDGMSFKKIKKAKIGGESFRDKLTAVWFELMDFAGKCNHSGAFISPSEIPFTNLADIATMIDREEEELRLCMAFYIEEGMIEIIDDIYSLVNWSTYQNKEGLDKIREQTRKRVAKHRETKKLLPGNVTCNVTVTQSNALDKEEELDIKNKKEIIDCQQIADMYNSICISFPSIRSLSDARKRAIKARLKTFTVDDFRTVFESAEKSSFLKGEGGGWKASFDWLIKESNMLKVLEGNYTDNDKPKTGGGRKEPVPGWMAHEPGQAELDAVQKLLKDDPDTAGNNPEIANRAEKLRQELQGV